MYLLSVSSECIVSSKHLSSVVTILSAVPESFLSISQKRGAIIASSTTEFGATKWKLAWSISLADKRVSLEMVSLQQVRKKEQGKEFWHLHYICFGSFAFKAKGQWIVPSQRLFIDLSVAKIRQETGGKLSVTNLSRSHSMKATTTTMKEVHRYVRGEVSVIGYKKIS